MEKASNHILQGEIEMPDTEGNTTILEESSNVYQRFAHTRHLLSSYYHRFILSLDNRNVGGKFKELLDSQGMSDGDFGKLLNRIEKWNNLEEPFPVNYVEFIGLDVKSVEDAAKADMEAFKESFKKAFYPDCFFVNTPSGVIRVGLPAGTNEKEAIKLATNFKHDEPIKVRFICIKDLKTIVIESEENYYTLTYPPELSQRKKMFIPGQMGTSQQGIDFP